MAHLHEVRDSDTHFIIDPITRVITNTAAAKNRLMQGDHNSEIFTFELPKTVEFHDMNLCNKVEIHYINVAADKTGTSTDVYDVQDFGAAEDDINAYAFSWRISDNATKYAGTLNFRIRFACTDGQGNYNYRWHTDIFKGITIADGFDNAPAVIADYSDILEQWHKELQNGVTEEQLANALEGYFTKNPIDIPEKLPNPYTLTFAGAVEGDYDGSEDKTITIPESGSGKVIYDVLLTEAVIEVSGTFEKAYKYLDIYTNVPKAEGNITNNNALKFLPNGLKGWWFTIGGISPYGPCQAREEVRVYDECVIIHGSSSISQSKQLANAEITHFIIRPNTSSEEDKIPIGTRIIIRGREEL